MSRSSPPRAARHPGSGFTDGGCTDRLTAAAQLNTEHRVSMEPPGLHAALPLGRSFYLVRWLRLSGPPYTSLVFQVSQGHSSQSPPNPSGEDWASQSGTIPPAVTNCHTRTHASRSYCKLCRGTGHPNSQSRISHAGAVHAHLSHIPLHVRAFTHTRLF